MFEDDLSRTLNAAAEAGPLGTCSPQRLPGLFGLIGDDMITIEASGARRTPLSGGPSEAIPGAENAVAMDLPWVMLATESAIVGQEPAESLNVATGEERKLAADLCAAMACLHSPVQQCSSDWCIR